MILITTPHGKVGEHIARLLSARGAPLRLAAHSPARTGRSFPAAEVVHLDYHDESSVAAALRGVHALYLAAPDAVGEVTLQRVIDLAHEQGVGRVVYLSVLGAELGDSPLRRTERHLEASGLEWTFLRPNWFMQNYSTTGAEAIREHGAFTEPTADARTSFVDTRDIAEIAVRALLDDTHAGQAYTITGGAAHDRHEVAAAISASLGRPVTYSPVSDAEFRAAATADGWPAAHIELMSHLYAWVRTGDTAVLNDTVERLLGRPPTTLQRFALDSRDAWLSPVGAA